MRGLSSRSKRTKIVSMQKRKGFFPVFLVLLGISVLLFLLGRFGALGGVRGIFESATVPLQKAVFGTIRSRDETADVSKLREENSRLAAQLAKKTEMEADNKALRDQFQTANPNPRTLLPASVIGALGTKLTIDRGSKDNVKKGSVVVVNDNLVGLVDKVTTRQAIVNLITREGISFTAKTLKSSSLGILKGQEGVLIFDNVVLTERLEKDDLVITKGNISEDGPSFPPDLVVGKIVSINKKASNLFQSAEVESLVDFSRLTTVFVIIGSD